MARLRVLVLASTYPRWSGDYEPGFVHELSRRLATEFEIHVVAPHAPGAARCEVMDGVFVHRFRYAPERIETLVQGGGILSNLRQSPWKWILVPAFFFGSAYQTLRCLQRFQPDCIHAHWIVPQGMVLAALGAFNKNSPPFLLTSHGGDLFGLRGMLFSWLKRWVLNRATTTTVVSQPMMSEAIRLGVPPERISVIPMGVDFTSRFSHKPLLARSPGEILFVGRLVEKKGLKYLIAAMPIIRQKVPGAYLVVIGDGPEMSALKAQVAALKIQDCVQFAGPLSQDQLPALYRRASVFVAPFVDAKSGDREGLGLVTIEAIACGCPVVVGDVAVVADIFLDTEKEMRVAPGDTGALADKVTAALLGVEAAVERVLVVRKRIEEQLAWSQIAQRYAEKLRSISAQALKSGSKS